MNAKELAAKLTGGEYRLEITKELAAEAKRHSLVVVFGASDDLMEFRGAIYDEIDCYGGGTAYLTPTGLLQNDCDNDDCPHFEKMKKRAAAIKALWDKEGYSWTFTTATPHETFEVVDDGEPYCRGIVFDLKDIKCSD